MKEVKLDYCKICHSKVYWCGEEPYADDHECHMITCSACGVLYDFTKEDDDDLYNLRVKISNIYNVK